MNKHFSTCALALVGITICWSLPAVAQSPTAGERCPAGSWFLDPVCVNKATGDVVNATPIAAAVTDEYGCAPGYWRLDQVCVSKATGDVELVEEQQMPKRKASSEGH